ncbi:unnamed protein product [Moneuplotes crassus]|uniref:MORN repeat-containing protein 3 n=1 Tax=Euplotes crassus TaxID=5936 RepID=A0A7S3KNT6_EUPCR|nr:unnamed protein product [Moneuplotes crassus]|mmetsp:Transcript_34105/g.33653  ORF Transcript_34105/g.33653 Transcript_34105/m.33653 type:complete len:414 (+) Transcript_34105:15-1256(+)|eukprot:CAMPEP_0197004010 /NCGR_PEP_ID=MMETSP1380-20130617/17428_1 /TAXON_ID=5936 /ORGANISM="Euplotes crassus, Strain CT5" /LENGTH=413 /DNA_ID=CAMNT_0042422651 /DNA_START=6 /DNA_END=1247 /DNA_ORIENTATION=-
MEDYSNKSSDYQVSEAGQSEPNFEHVWKKNDRKAQKNGPHRSIYWVKKNTKLNTDKGAREPVSSLQTKWVSSSRYIGDWKENTKEGFGIQIYKNKDKYEGLWANNMRHGQGTYWRNEAGKLKREYTGDWFEDKKHGRGTFFYKNGDRYDGFWVNGKPQGEGRIIYESQDIYEGQWHEGKKSGYGVLVKKNGDHFEGHWVNDKKEGQGSYLFSEKNKLFVGEWVDDNPKCGIYTEVEDKEAPVGNDRPHFMDDYQMPKLPSIKLENPTEILEKAMGRTKKERARYRAQYIPLDEMFTNQELEDLQQAFDSVAQGESEVNMLTLKTLFSDIGIFPSDEMLNDLLKSLGKEIDDDEISFELYARSVALLLEENHHMDDNSDANPGVEKESPMKSAHESDINMGDYQQEYSQEYDEM